VLCWRELTDRSPPQVFSRGHPNVTGATVDKSGAPAYVTDRSSSPFQRPPAKGAAILKNGMPFTVVTTACGLERITPSVLTRRPLAHAAHTFSPSWGECLIWALQASQGGYPLSVTFVTSRDEHLFNLPVKSRLEVDVPSVPAGSIGLAVDRS